VKTILPAVLALVALMSTVLADGAVELTDAQMDKITAGVGNTRMSNPVVNTVFTVASGGVFPISLTRIGNDVNARVTVDGRTLRQGGNNGDGVGNVLAVY
jgi:hypothetical protein